MLEYGAHVRDVHRLFGERVRLVLTANDPVFANWDQDETAVVERYAEQDPAVVAAELARAAADLADLLDAVPDAARERPARRSNGSTFTLRTLVQYYLHDVVHHTHDVAA
ncbi:DinB family protein [Cellulomonas sp. ATA003]|uniref:DinB family protein n=1 Tax=Cellulomonas sp. ATA003 TaxID=3073064 RepID=UPI002872DFBC|nr:DinB family protein [Cellulomonas sp. ATA003]WNB85705.1 maleylpyruvate isomerase N-terminal domain-containing protein [Cellulomonas sp. ATA003]